MTEGVQVLVFNTLNTLQDTNISLFLRTFDFVSYFMRQICGSSDNQPSHCRGHELFCHVPPGTVII